MKNIVCTSARHPRETSSAWFPSSVGLESQKHAFVPEAHGSFCFSPPRRAACGAAGPESNSYRCEPLWYSTVPCRRLDTNVRIEDKSSVKCLLFRPSLVHDDCCYVCLSVMGPRTVDSGADAPNRWALGWGSVGGARWGGARNGP